MWMPMPWAWRTGEADDERHDNGAASRARLGICRYPGSMGCGSDGAECVEAVSVTPSHRRFGEGIKKTWMAGPSPATMNGAGWGHVMLRRRQFRLHDAEQARLQCGVGLQCTSAALV